MTEREREEELFKRAEKREEARKRFVGQLIANSTGRHDISLMKTSS